MYKDCGRKSDKANEKQPGADVSQHDTVGDESPAHSTHQEIWPSTGAVK